MDLFYNSTLPVELVLKIIYEHKGLQHPVSIVFKEELLKQLSDENVCWNCKIDKSNASLCKLDKLDIHHQLDTSLKKLAYNLLNKKINICFSCAH